MSNPVSPDDLCLVCNTPRVDHGDRQHKFSLDGQLRNLDPAPQPRAQAPRVQGDVTREELIQKLSEDFHTNGFLRLMEVLIGKGTFTAEETLFIFSGHRGSDAGPKA